MAKPAKKLDTSTPARLADEGLSLNPAESAGDADFPCSAAQERFWLLDRLDPGNSSYNVAVRWRLEGKIATDLLEGSWLKIIERHEILRTVFLEIEGTPVQRVMPRVQFRLNEIDLSNLPAELQQTEGDRIGVIEARAPFDLSCGPLIRATLLRYSPTVSIILVTTHQIVSDGWSIGVMAREMGVVYDALRHGKLIALEPLAIQYTDYSLWRLEWLKVRGTAAETAYWTRQLAGIKPFKVLPDHPRPAMPTANGAIASRVLPRDLTNRAQTLSAELGATLFGTVFAAFCATLARFTDETEIVVGTQVSDRDQVELEPMVGQFVNSLILRNDLGGNPTFGTIVERSRDTIAQALEQRHIPIEQLLGMVKSEKSAANTPPISVNFIFQKTFIQNTSYTGFSLIDMPSLPAGAIYDLNFFMVERPDGWRFSCQYNTDQFEAATADRLLRYFETLLESAVANPAQRLSELGLSAADESRQLLAKFNDTRTLYPRDLTLPALFEAQAAHAPDSIAVICDDRQLSYGEINASADRFAHYLRRHGVAPGARVGVCLVTSMELPICLLAVLKAGASFMILDPDDPPLRRADLIRAAGVTVIIGQRLQHESASDLPDLIDVEAALALGDEAARGPVPVRPDSDTPACLVLGAGPDGPRIIDVSHRNLTNLIYSLAKRPGVDDRDVVVAIPPFTVDTAAFDIFLPLLRGARLVIAQDAQVASGRGLLQLLQRTNATVLYGGSQLWNGLLEAGWIGSPALKMLCPALELGPRLIDKLSPMGGELWSTYGHPETGIWSSIRRVTAKHVMDAGDPIANTVLYVLDSSQQTAPVGAIGELYIGGDGLTGSARAEAIRHESNVELYPTGDVARLQASGRIEIMGRNDDRFTWRGRAIDPSEIERVLLRQIDVAEAGVALLDDGSDAAAITAFIVPKNAAHGDTAALATALQEWAAQSLPASLVPAVFLLCDSLPHLANGAVDRRALPHARARSKRADPQNRPSGEIEERLALIWASMLGLESVSAADNFFELGGHSLLAARMLTRVEREFGRRIKLATLFLAPTLQEFAKALAQGDLREFDFRQVVKIQPHGSRRPLIVVNNTGIYYGLAKGLGSEQPVYSLQLFDPSVRDATLPATLPEIAAGYVSLIRRVQPQGPYDLMGWCVAGALAFEIAQQLVDDHQTVSHLFLIDSWVPGYFKRMPRLRGLIASYSLRGQLIFADLRRVLTSEKSVRSFIMQRTLVKKLTRLFLRARGAADLGGHGDQTSLETYDQWLLAYLQELTARFEPRSYQGKVILLRSRQEPTGWFFKEDAGWAAFARSGVDLHFVDGNHFTMFQDPGSSQMAAFVAAALAEDESTQTPKP
jgi:non-ribosomal peptide synthetase component F/thioesterase domain-containing protein/acyl carrier protein